MHVNLVNPESNLEEIKLVAQSAFQNTPDSSLEEWFSFSEMKDNLKSGRGLCVKSESDSGEIVGMLYAQQESPINGKEGLEKWVIVIAAVLPKFSGQGVGTELLRKIEVEVKHKGALKLFTYTNKDDQKVIDFYKKNGFVDAGWIKDYQYGKNNSAVFLLKYL
ncbi:MAG: GNAT family N-acetyltransferase [Patescibacteria group bacterium]|jgi:ribosomal protein S18 acetylase RimI-like enzyme